MAKIETVEALREIYPPAAGRAVDKELGTLDPHCKRFIKLSPFLLLATHDADGIVDITPRGDHPGFVSVPDGNTIFIPDRPGNNRLDSLTNILSNPTCSVIFLIPGVDETLRIRGTAEIRNEADLLAEFEVNNRLPRTVLKINVDLAFLHCAKALMRSRLWDPEAQIERAELPTLGKMIMDQLGQKDDGESQEQMIAHYTKELY